MNKPSIAELLSASGHTTYTPALVTRAMYALYGNVGANLDGRDWLAIMQGQDPLALAEAGLVRMNTDPVYLVENIVHLTNAGYVPAQAEITYRQLAQRLEFDHNTNWSVGTAYPDLGSLSMDALIAQVPVTPVTPPSPTFTVTSSSITPSDVDNSHTYTSGDTITLKFSAAIDATKLTIGDLALSGGHSLGTGATLTPTTGTATDFVITLGTSATVAKSDTITIAKAKLVNSSGTAASADVAFTVGAVETVAPTYTSAALSGANKVVTLTYDENVESNVADAAALKAAVTFAADGETFAALGTNDTVAIVDGKLVVTFENALTGTTNEILVAASTLKDAAGNVLASAVNTAAVSAAADNTAPFITSGSFTEGVDPSTITLTFNEAMKVTGLDGVSIERMFSYVVSDTISTKSITADETTVNIGLVDAQLYGFEFVKVTFDKDTSNIADLAGNKPDLPTFYIGGSGGNNMFAYDESTGVRMEGNAGDDNLLGSDHADTIIGGAGTDRLKGGTGADTFEFKAGDSGVVSGSIFDTIRDYTAGAGGDVLYLGAAVVVAYTSGVNVTAAVDGSGASNVTAAISNGVITLAGLNSDTFLSLDQWLAVARLVVTTGTHVAAFQFESDTYVFQENGAVGDLLIQLEGVTDITAVGTSAAANTILISDFYG